MITSNTQHGERITDTDIANQRFQAFLDEITASLNDERTIFTVATVPDAALNEGRRLYVGDETGGGTIAFSDGTNWRRCQDRNIIS